MAAVRRPLAGGADGVLGADAGRVLKPAQDVL
jgi:hypothetical protein